MKMMKLELTSIFSTEDIWQVNIARTGLGLSRNIIGLHRLAIANSILYIFKVDPSNDTPDIYEFPLSSVRKCGHNTSTFFFELGRSSLVGAGTLWLHTEDQAMAMNIHDVVLNSMSSNSIITPSGAVIEKDPNKNNNNLINSNARKRSSELQLSQQENNSSSTSSSAMLPRSNSINSTNNQQQQNTSNQNHRPRSCSEVSKCSTSMQQSPAANSTNSNSHFYNGSRRNSKTLTSPPQLSSSSSTSTTQHTSCSCCLPQQSQQFYVHDAHQGHCGCGGHLPHFSHQPQHGHHFVQHPQFVHSHVPPQHAPTFLYHLPASGHQSGARTSLTSTGQTMHSPSSSMQSPANSRERLHSGSWSRTTSECSEDGNVGSCGCASSSATPMGVYCEGCLSNLHYFNNSNAYHPCACQVQRNR